MIDSHEKLGLGTVQFGLNYGVANVKGQTSIDEVGKILAAAVDNNVNLIDTASAYGDSEEVLGQFDLRNFKVVSKFMSFDDVSLEVLIKQSLHKLKIDRLYGYLAHRPLSLLKNERWNELNDLKAKNLVEKIGFSLNEPSELEALLEKGYFPDIIQVPYNYFDHRFEEQMKILKSKGCEIHTRSTFLQGLFFVNPEKLNPFFNEIKPTLSELQQKYGSMEKLLINYVLNKKFIDRVIIGVENNSQFLQNLNSFQESEELPEMNYNFSDDILMPMYWPKNTLNE